MRPRPRWRKVSTAAAATVSRSVTRGDGGRLATGSGSGTSTGHHAGQTWPRPERTTGRSMHTESDARARRHATGLARDASLGRSATIRPSHFAAGSWMGWHGPGPDPAASPRGVIGLTR